MKRQFAFIAILFILMGFLSAQNSNAVERPVVESFVVSKTDLDITAPDLNVNFEVVVSHPAGIVDRFTTLTLSNAGAFSVSTELKRIDSPIDYLNKKVTFRGGIEIPRNFKTGVYTYSINGVTSGVEKINSNSSLAISQIYSGVVTGPVLRTLKNAESGILVRNKGYLDLNYPTINGPAYGIQSGLTYVDNLKFSGVIAPIWKVNEIIDLSSYFELIIAETELVVATTSPKVCVATGTLLKLLSEGDCSFSVSTPRTKNYQAKTIYQSQAITSARKPAILFVEKIANQQAKNLPITLELPKVYSSGLSVVDYVLPKSITPNICETGGYILKIISGGICSITYQSLGNNLYLPSDTYTQSIIIEKQPQTIVFQPVPTVDVKNRILDLSATASSKGAISFSTTSAGICSITGSTLNLIKAGNCSVTAIQAGTSSFAPVSASVDIALIGKTAEAYKSIKCIRGKVVKKIIGANPKCPDTYTSQK